MNVVDSSAWIEYFTDGPNACHFAKAIETTETLIVPTLTLYEVFKRVYVKGGEASALEKVAHMLQGRVVELSAALALTAARLSVEENLSMADAIIFASARAHDATLWTQDVHFKGKAKVEYRPARQR